MMLGVAIPESVHPGPETLLALDAWVARSRMPDLFPVWSRRRPDDTEWPLDRSLLSGIRERGVEPVVYATSHNVTYPDILAGVHDTALRLLALRAEGCVVRWDHEMDSDGLDASWQREMPERYVEVFRHVSMTMRAEADVRLFWCPVQPAKAREWWPGAESVQVIGFDRYRWDEGDAFPPEQWAAPIRACRRIAPGLPILIGECGSKGGLTRRAEWLRSIAETGVDAVVMDLLVGSGFEHDWRWSASMRRAFAGMMV